MTGVYRGLAVLIAIGFVAVSMTINLRFGLKASTDEFDKWVYVAISVLADCWKAIGLTFVAVALRRMFVMRAALGLGAWMCCAAYSLSSALGYAAHNRAVMAGEITTRSSEVARIEADRRRKGAQLERLGNYEPAGVVDAALQAEREKVEWRQSRECMDTAAQSRLRTFCQEYRRLEGALARANEGTRLEREIAELGLRKAKLEGAAKGRPAGGASGDGQADLLAGLLGVELPVMQLWLSLLVVGLVEFGSTGILFVALLPAAPTAATKDIAQHPAPPIADQAAEAVWVVPALAPPAALDENLKAIEAGGSTRAGRIESFMLERIGYCPGQLLAVRDIESAYRAWCDARGESAQAAEPFEDRFAKLCQEVEYRIETQRGLRVLRDAAFISINEPRAVRPPSAPGGGHGS